MSFQEKALISYFARTGSLEKREKITEVRFSDVDVGSEDINQILESFPNLDQIVFKFGPFEKHFKNGVINNLPNVVMNDYTHGAEHLRFVFEFANKCRTLSFKDTDYYRICEILRIDKTFGKKFVVFGNKIINLERLGEISLENEQIQVNKNNISCLNDINNNDNSNNNSIKSRKENVSFLGSLEDISKLSEEDLSKIGEITLVISKASELSNEELRDLIFKRKFPITKVQIYSKHNSPSQNTPYDVKLYSVLRNKLDELVGDIPDDLEEEIKFARIYEKVATEIKYEYTQYDKLSVQFRNLSNLTSALLDKKAICAGFAEVLEQALSLEGIECVKASGEVYGANESHNWNKVKLKGKWYNVDATWDRERLSRRRLPIFALKSDRNFRKTRFEDQFDAETPDCRVSISLERLRDIFGMKRLPTDIRLRGYRSFSKRKIKKNPNIRMPLVKENRNNNQVIFDR